MTWQDRLKPAAYTPPSGVRLEFQYENVRRVFSKKTSGFNFPDAAGTYVQDSGRTGRRYPLRCFFWGSNYDLEAAAFESALEEAGVGVLEHPVYGSVNVVPFGDITRRDDLVTEANQAIIEVTFWDTIGLIYPGPQVDAAAATLAAVAAFNAAQAEEFAEGMDLDSALQQVTFKDKYNALLDKAEAGLQAVADVQTDVQREFDGIVDSINRGIDVLVADPLTLAFQTSVMLQAPARALTAIEARLTAYANLARDLFTTDDDATLTANELRTRDLFAMSYSSGQAVASINATFATRSQAIQAAEDVAELFEDIRTWRDTEYFETGELDTGAAYQALQQTVATVSGYLVQLSFSLKQERAIVLDRPRSIVDLTAELYGSVDSMLDFFVDSNDLSGREILEIPKGRRIVYYV